MTPPLASFFGDVGNAFDFIFHKQDSVAGGTQVGGSDIWPLLWTHLWVVFASMVIASAIAIPVALWLGHRGKGQFAAASAANVGRAVPSIAVLVFFSAYLGLGNVNLIFAMVLLAIPPIFTNTYVGIRQVDRDAVDAARGMGMSGPQIVAKVELPLALPLLFGGLRTSTVNVIATATLGPLVGVLTLGDLIINANVNGPAGRLAGAILVALLALAAEITFALLQRAVTPRGLRVAHSSRRSWWRRTRRQGSMPPTIPAP
jgi:osmoprotectant transport system permease protein